MSKNTSFLSIRRFKRDDLPEALAIQSQVYPAFLVENEASFASRLDVGGAYCLVANLEGQLAGYLLAHGWQRNSPPQLGAPLLDTQPAEILLIHDLAVATRGQGLGVARKLVNCALDIAAQNGLNSAELVAVEGAASFWRALGFADLEVSPEITAKLAGYGNRVVWMGRDIE